MRLQKKGNQMDILTNSILRDYFKCEYKAYLKRQGESGIKSEFEILEEKTTKSIREKYFSQFFADSHSVLTDFDLNNTAFNGNEIFSINCRLKTKKFDISFDAIKIIKESHEENKKSDKYIYSPIEIVSREKITSNDKLTLAIKCLVLSLSLDIQVEVAEIIHGQSMKHTKIKLIDYLKKSQKYLKKILRFIEDEISPDLYWIEHCKICEFQKSCREKLIERDDISLLGSINKEDAVRWKNKGIFTILQLSYTFKYKKREEFASSNSKPDASLKALALREKKIYIKKIPEIITSDTEVYLDFEGIPDEDFIYLIGVVIKTKEKEDYIYSWIDSKDKQKHLFEWLFSIIGKSQNPHIFYYGSYEIRVLEKFDKCSNNAYHKEIYFIKENSTNILNFLASTIYVPTYTNSLKEVARFLGFNWSKKDISGIESIVWRKEWETSHNEDVKQDLILYNKEDCLALKLVKEWLCTINSKINHLDDNVVLYANEIEVTNKPRWGDTDYKIADFQDINQLAYFDYQRNKIYVRTSAKLRKIANRSQRVNTNKIVAIDKKIKSYPDTCPYCNKKEFFVKEKRVKILIDLKFIKGGIKRYVKEVESGILKCQNCQEIFTSDEYGELIRYHSSFKYGHNLMIWCIYEYVVHHNSYAKISNMLSDYYGLSISLWAIPNFKEIISQEYVTTYEELKQCLMNGELICADETKVDILDSNSPAYVWVFTNMTSVIYLPKRTREGDFLKEFLRDFNGILVSDFYSAYDSLDCLPQKCLVHLIRDLNNDFAKNQFDEDYKSFVVEFGKLLRKIIIETLDKYGLKKRHLSKHKKDVDKFFNDFVDKEFESEILEKYQKRFQKYKEKLFVFLSYDGIPWNNNNAEHAIKPFAKYRRNIDGKVTEKTLDEYLVLLSIQQTCEYRGLNFLEFLKSKEKSIEAFSERCLKW
jgi:predicted RecB family nuclease